MDNTQKQLQCVVVTPERAVLDQRVDFVAVPMYDGELGIQPGHSPLIGRLGPGELRTVHGQETRRFFVDGGFVQVHADVVTVLTPRALPAEEINLEAAQVKLQAALVPALTPEALQAQHQAQERARAQIRIAQHLQEH